MNVNECSFCKDVWNSDNLIGVEFDDIKILLCPECKEKFDSLFVSIPKGATNGDVVLGINETAQVYGIDKRENIIKVCLDGIRIQFFDLEWWNAPYKEEVEV